MTSLGTMRPLLILMALTLTSPAIARGTTGLTVPIGETWMFRVERGQPGHARKVTPTTRPRPGEIRQIGRASCRERVSVLV